MDKRPHWLAGPLSYKTTDSGAFPDRLIQVCKWEFIGGTPAGGLRRWHPCFAVNGRRFYSNDLTVTDWDKAHAEDLATFYRPVAVLRSMLPKGSIAAAMKAMLKEADIAEAMAIAIRGGKANG